MHKPLADVSQKRAAGVRTCWRIGNLLNSSLKCLGVICLAIPYCSPVLHTSLSRSIKNICSGFTGDHRVVPHGVGRLDAEQSWKVCLVLALKQQ